MPRIDEGLRADLAERTARFRDELATDYLLATREAMRYGAIPEGWRADYAKGVSGLLRLLSLDRDNVRLLTAMVEICNDWFLDLYNAGDPRRLAEHVDRFTPFAAQLARLVEDRPGDLAARAALSDFYKFRGFTAATAPARRSCTARRCASTPATTTCATCSRTCEPADRPPRRPNPAKERERRRGMNPFEVLRLDPSSSEEEVVKQAGRLRHAPPTRPS